jgi:predicted small secreted protein
MKPEEDENMTAVKILDDRQKRRNIIWRKFEMKKTLAIALAMLLALFMLTACGGGVGGNGGGGSSGGGSTAAPAVSSDDDKCLCDPECTNKKCEGGDKCKCGTDGERPPLTYDIWIEVANMCPVHDDSYGCGIITNGTARVTMNFIDSKTGYRGSSSDGIGETIKNGMCNTEVGGLAPGDLRIYDFSAQLSVPGDNKNILVGIDRLGPDEFTYDYSVWEGLEITTSQSFFSYFFQHMMENSTPPEYGLVAYPDPDAGLLIFEVPLIEDSDNQGQQYKWGDIFISITLIPVTE